MKKEIMLAVLITAIATFTITENYAISHVKVSGNTGNYRVEMFGNTFVQEGEG